jgi:hypothetical protein
MYYVITRTRIIGLVTAMPGGYETFEAAWRKVEEIREWNPQSNKYVEIVKTVTVNVKGEEGNA